MNLLASSTHPTSAAPADLLEFPTSAEGYVDHWLVAGPQRIPVTDLARYDEHHPRPGILENYHNPALLVHEAPAEGRTLVVEDLHGACSLPWRFVQCQADHFVDSSTFGFNCQYIRSWAFTTLSSTTYQAAVNLVVTANGPFDVWINGRHIHRHSGFHYQIPKSTAFRANLEKGDNRIVIAFEVIAIRECPYVVALQVQAEEVTVRLPTVLPAEKRGVYSTMLAAAQLDRTLFHRSDRLLVRWPRNLPVSGLIRLQLRTPSNEIKSESEFSVAGGTILDLGCASEYPDGAYILTILPSDDLFAGSLFRDITLRIANGDCSTAPYGSYEERILEALAVATRQDHLFSEFAKMELGEWSSLSRKHWIEPLRRIRERGDCSDFYLLGMLGALHRHGADPSFPKSLREEITEAALGFRYWMDEPGHDAMCFHTENHQILFHACEVLAGQMFPDEVFPNAGKNGRWHREKAERLAMAWLRRKGIEGFQEWDSNVYFEIDVVALSHLAGLADNPDLATLAAMVLDKLCATMAMHSFRGVFGSTHGRVYTENIKGGRLELTSGLCRMLWGMGTYNHHIMGTVSLATSSYRLPSAIYQIATEPPGEAWMRERQGGKFDPNTDCRDGQWEINKVTYKTDDYMLCSAQDYLPGIPGNQQHIWQATFGPDAVVFTTHPVCVSEDSYHRPNFWHGNGILPRVAQWKDLLVAFYNLPPSDWMGFTHAYFPTSQFDESILRCGWAFARKDQGYLAIAAYNGLELVSSATGAFEELRSFGPRNTWICQMGRKSQDGSFAEFQESVIASIALKKDSLSFENRTVRGSEISFSWNGAFTVDGEEKVLRAFPNYDGPFAKSAGESQVTFQSRSQFLHLDFDAILRKTGRTI